MLRKIAAVIIEKRKFLVVRDSTEDFFKMPGGKVDGDESDEECLRRELQEELKVDAKMGDFLLSAMGKTTKGDPIKTDFHLATYEGTPEPSNEIGELRFIGSGENIKTVYTINEFLIPLLIERNLID